MIVFCKKLKRQVLSEADCYFCEGYKNCFLLPEDLLNEKHKDYSLFYVGFYRLDNLLQYLYNIISEKEILVDQRIKDAYKNIYESIKDCFKDLEDVLIEISKEK